MMFETKPVLKLFCGKRFISQSSQQALNLFAHLFGLNQLAQCVANDNEHKFDKATKTEESAAASTL